MKQLSFLIILFSVITLSACNSDENSTVDTQKPTIDLTVANAFPLNGDTIYFDVPFTVNMLFADNVQLGSYSIDIHNNFDHHSHSTEEENKSVTLDPVKTPINPYTFIQDYDIPSGSISYTPNITLTIPSTDVNGHVYDEGDYHFMLQLTDHEGWSINKGLSIKILHL